MTYPDITARWPLFVLRTLPPVVLGCFAFKSENRVAFQDGNAMEDETFGRHVRWIEDHEGCRTQLYGNLFGRWETFHSCVLLEHKKLRSARFPEIAFFGISRCCANCFFREERITKPFSVFLFLSRNKFSEQSDEKLVTHYVKNKPFDWLSKRCNNNTRRNRWTLVAAFCAVFHEILSMKLH